MHHFYEVPRDARPRVNVAAPGAGITRLAALCTRDLTRPGGERRENRIEVINSLPEVPRSM